jgi:hypothetical protein
MVSSASGMGEENRSHRTAGPSSRPTNFVTTRSTRMGHLEGIARGLAGRPEGILLSLPAVKVPYAAPAALSGCCFPPPRFASSSFLLVALSLLLPITPLSPPPPNHGSPRREPCREADRDAAGHVDHAARGERGGYPGTQVPGEVGWGSPLGAGFMCAVGWWGPNLSYKSRHGVG